MPAAVPTAQVAGVYHRRVGDIVVTAISDGYLDGSMAVIQNIAEAEAAHAEQEDDQPEQGQLPEDEEPQDEELQDEEEGEP